MVTEETQDGFNAEAFAEAEEAHILSTLPADEQPAEQPEFKGLTQAQKNSRKQLSTLVEQCARLAKKKGIRFVSFHESPDVAFKETVSCDIAYIRGIVQYLAFAFNTEFNDAVKELHEIVNAQQPQDEQPAQPQGDQGNAGQPAGDAGVCEAPRD